MPYYMGYLTGEEVVKDNAKIKCLQVNDFDKAQGIIWGFAKAKSTILRFKREILAVLQLEGFASQLASFTEADFTPDKPIFSVMPFVSDAAEAFVLFMGSEIDDACILMGTLPDGLDKFEEVAFAYGVLDVGPTEAILRAQAWRNKS